MKLEALLIKEEWRLHSTLFGGGHLALLPPLITLLAAATTLATPLATEAFSKQQLINASHLAYLFLGLNSGAFGLYAKELLNRRFGQASLLLYAARTLPLTNTRLLAATITKDVTYYFATWILPPILGAAATAPIIGIVQASVWTLLLTNTLSFLLGLSIVFALSTIYAHSKPALLLTAALAITYLTATGAPQLPTTTLYEQPSLQLTALILLVIAALTTTSLLFPKSHFKTPKHQHQPQLTKLANKIPLRNNTLVAKELLELQRSGGIGKAIFGLALPLALIWWFVNYFATYFPTVPAPILLAILSGVFSPVAYQWLTQHDNQQAYSNLPLQAGQLINAKRAATHLIITAVGAVVLAASLQTPTLIAPSIGIYALISYYTLSITTALTGLQPHTKLLNPTTLSAYLLLVVTPAAAAVILTVFQPNLLWGLILLLPAGYSAHKKRLNHWNEQRT